MHDFSPANGEGLDGRPGDSDPHGVFWLARIADDDVEVTDHEVRVNVSELPEIDRFQFLGSGNVPAHLSFQITFSKTGAPRKIFPRSDTDLLPHEGNPFNWAGTVWDGTATGSFSFRYDDGSYSGQGTSDSTLPTHELTQYGTIGRERNGFFARPPWWW